MCLPKILLQQPRKNLLQTICKIGGWQIFVNVPLCEERKLCYLFQWMTTPVLLSRVDLLIARWVMGLRFSLIYNYLDSWTVWKGSIVDDSFYLWQAWINRSSDSFHSKNSLYIPNTRDRTLENPYRFIQYVNWLVKASWNLISLNNDHFSLLVSLAHLNTNTPSNYLFFILKYFLQYLCVPIIFMFPTLQK